MRKHEGFVHLTFDCATPTVVWDDMVEVLYCTVLYCTVLYCTFPDLNVVSRSLL